RRRIFRPVSRYTLLSRLTRKAHRGSVGAGATIATDRRRSTRSAPGCHRGLGTANIVASFRWSDYRSAPPSALPRTATASTPTPPPHRRRDPPGSAKLLPAQLTRV